MNLSNIFSKKYQFYVTIQKILYLNNHNNNKSIFSISFVSTDNSALDFGRKKRGIRMIY